MLAINQIEWIESPKKHLKQKQMYFAWFASCRLLVWNAGELMDEAEYKRSLKVSARTRICISIDAIHIHVRVYRIHVCARGWHSKHRFRKYNHKKTNPTRRSTITASAAASATTSTPSPPSEELQTRIRIRNTFKNASQGCCCCACAIRVLTRKPTM